MASAPVILSLLFVVAISIGSGLHGWFQSWAGSRSQSANILNALIGDSRRLFANHFFAKADAYFHSGYYPSIFDSQKRNEESHLAGGGDSGVAPNDVEHDSEAHVHDEHCNHATEETHVHDEHCDHGEGEGDFLGEPRDWIDRFSRNFFPVEHSHLEKGGERELLPWLRIAAELDPQRVETYTIASYWLRSRLQKIDDAEQFLRDGLRANPDSFEIYFELGRLHDENRKDGQMARNLWEIGLRKWVNQARRAAEQDNDALKPDEVVLDGILIRLARLEESVGNIPKAIEYLRMLEAKTPEPAVIQEQITELEKKLRR